VRFGFAKTDHFIACKKLPRVSRQGLNPLALDDGDLCEQAVSARNLAATDPLDLRYSAGKLHSHAISVLAYLSGRK
jgi:hypothetical protein